MSAEDPERFEGSDAPGPRYCTYTSYEDGEPVDGFPWTGPGGAADDGVADRIADALADVEDPEMPISVLDLGLVYGVTVEDGQATVDLTLTYTGCPARDLLQESVRRAVADVEGVEDADVRLVWQPEWTVEMVTEDGKDQLREFGLSV
ncbi:MAG: 1,2-phenylacetyl-CoA epoxidase subunit PaaD [Halobacteriales archaeon]